MPFSIKKWLSGRWSLLAVLLAIAWTAGTVNNYKSYKNAGPWGIFRDDMLAYYVYLPALFVHDCDFEFKYVETSAENEFHKFQPVTAPRTGKTVNKVTCGLAMMMLPFYVIADKYVAIVQPQRDGRRDGFSEPYRVAVMYGLVFYELLALLLLRRLLLKYFSDGATALALLGTLLGTNLFYYSVHESAMSHGWSFCLYCAFLFLTDRWHTSRRWGDMALLGAVSGLIFLVRPTNLVIGLFFILYGVKNWGGIAARARLFADKKWHILAAILAGLAVAFPQLLLWKTNTGDWLFFSYDRRFERFYWTDPAIWQGLFSYQRGWFVYTPLMFLAFFGLFFLKKRHENWFWPVVAFSVANIYVVLSWWSWWYGGGFSLRAFAEAAAPMAVPLAALVDGAFSKNLFAKISVATAVVLCVALNLFQVRQYHEGFIRWTGMTRERYWGVFGKYYLTPEDHQKYDNMYDDPSR